MNPDKDLVFYKDKDGSYMSGGYKIQSELFENTIKNTEETQMQNIESDSPLHNQNGGSLLFSEMFKDMIVPAGLLFLQQNYKGSKKTIKDISVGNLLKETEMIGDDLYDKLVGLVTPNKKKRHNIKTRKMKIKNIKSKTQQNKVSKRRKTRKSKS